MLMRRKDELETQLTRARGTDFSNARTDIVSIGTIVQATDLGANQPETFTILGAWDSDPDKASSVISRPSRSHCSITKSATKWNLSCTARNAGIASNASRLSGLQPLRRMERRPSQLRKTQPAQSFYLFAPS